MPRPEPLATDATSPRSLAGMAQRGQTWGTAALAKTAGITTRTLRHYEQIGLLVPSARTEAGHRRYNAEDVARLYRILSLRRLGLSLDEIKVTLESTAGDLALVVRRHLEDVEREIAGQQRLRGHLDAVLVALSETDQSVPITQIIGVLEGMTMLDRYLTSEQLTRLRSRREALRETLREAPDGEPSALVARLEAAREDGVDPASDEAREAARRLREGFLEFIDDRETVLALASMVEREGPELATSGTVGPEFVAYLKRALEADESKAQ